MGKTEYLLKLNSHSPTICTIARLVITGLLGLRDNNRVQVFLFFRFRSSLDGYCPDHQVTDIQSKTVDVLKKVYESIDVDE